MNRDQPSPARSAVARCTVTVCRGCCCGTASVPGLDHAAQLAQLRAALAGIAHLRTSDCLDTCEHANVIVIQPSTAGRVAGGRPVWLGLLNQPGAAGHIATWLGAGGPGLADPPIELDLHMFTPARRARQTLA